MKCAEQQILYRQRAVNSPQQQSGSGSTLRARKKVAAVCIDGFITIQIYIFKNVPDLTHYQYRIINLTWNAIFKAGR